MTPTTLQPNRRVLLAGAFGQGNPGDEALLSAFAGGIGETLPVAASTAPASTAATHGIAAVGRDDMPLSPREIRRAESVVIAGGTIFKSLHPSSGRRRLSLRPKALRSSSCGTSRNRSRASASARRWATRKSTSSVWSGSASSPCGPGASIS